jgi:hypothetical protein
MLRPPARFPHVSLFCFRIYLHARRLQLTDAQALAFIHAQTTILNRPYPSVARVVGHVVFDATLAAILATDLYNEGRADASPQVLSTSALSLVFVILHGLTLLCKPLTPRNRLFAPTAPQELAGVSLLSLLTYSYLTDYIALAAKGVINITELRPDANAATALHAFRTLSTRHPKLGFKMRLVLYLKSPLVQQFTLALMAAGFNLLQPLFLQKLLAWLTDRSTADLGQAILYVVGMAGFSLLNAMFSNRCLLVGRQMSMQVRAVLMGELFAKTLRRGDLAVTGNDGRNAVSSSGKISNLVSSDVTKFAELVCYLYMIFPNGTTVLAAGVILLFRVIGIAALAGLLVLIVQIPIVSAFGRLYGKYSGEVQSATDQRLHLAQEVFQAIRIVKSFAWEKSFTARLTEKRDIELKLMRRRLAVKVVFASSFLSGSIAVYALLLRYGT